MIVKGGMVLPFLYKNEMSRILFINIQIISNTERLSLRCCYQLTVQRYNYSNTLGFYEIFGNDF